MGRIHFYALMTSVSLLWAMPVAAHYSRAEINTIETRNVAIHGYDPVSYFEEGQPRMGSEQFSVEYNGVKWQFASEEHMNLFLERPRRYLPRYGGFCAFGTAAGYKSDVEPTVWAMHDGQLYLFYSEKAKQSWESRIDKLRVAADLEWSHLRGKPII